MSMINGGTAFPGTVQPPVAASIVHLETHDVFLQASSLPKWEQEYLQISKGAFRGRISEFSLGPIQLFRETMDKAVDQHGQPWANSVAIGVPIKVEGDGYWCGDRIENDSIFFLSPNSALKFKTPLSSDIYVAVIDQSLIRQYADEIEDANIDQACQLNGVERASHQLCTTLRNSFRHVFEGISNNPGALNNEAVLQALRNDVMLTLFNGLGSMGRLQQRTPGQFVHRHIVEKAKEYILSRKDHPPTILEICQELRISRRTLHYAFQKVLDINPITFLRYIRLHGARQELLGAHSKDVLISEVAAQWGFWHLGMFSTYYRQLFGETPSSTVRRTRFN